jgi:FOG: HPt domain
MNFKKLAEDLGLEEEEYMELIELFIDVGMSDLDRLHSAIEEGDSEKAAKAAHSLKGAAGNLGLMELSKTAKEIEEEAGNDRLDETADAAQTLKEKLDFLVEAVKRLGSVMK